MGNKTKDLYEFGDYKVDPNEGVLYRGDKLIRLAPKVFETLLLLVENNGKILSKDEMMDGIWKDSFVEEGNLTQNIYTLRRIFGRRNKFIKTIPKRGYIFEANIKTVENGNGFVSGAEAGIVEVLPQEGLSEVVVARRTRTTIIDEEVIEEDSGESVSHEKTKFLPEADHKKPFAKSRRFRLGIGIGTISAILIGAIGFLVWQSNQLPITDSPLDKITVSNLTDSGNVADFAISPNGLFLAIVKRDPNNTFSVWLRDIESKEEVPIKIPSRFQPLKVNFSPDGKTLYFLSRQENTPGAEIHKTSRFGGKTDYVTGDVWSGFSVSPSGKKIAFFRRKAEKNRFQLVIWDLKSKSERIVLTKDFPDAFAPRTSPAWSPDEEEIYAISSLQAKPISKLVRVKVATGEETVLKIPQIRQFISVVAMPNGRDLIFGAREKGRFPQVYKVSKSGGNVIRLTNDPNYYRNLALSSDGRNLVASQKANFSHIWRIPDGDPAKAVQLTRGKDNRDGKHGIDALPDGKVVFTSLEGFNRDLWLVDPADKSLQQLTVDVSHINQRPLSSADGKFVYFSSMEGRTFRIKRISVANKTVETLTNDASVSDRFPNVSNDGETLYFIRQGKGKSSITRKSMADGIESEILTPEGSFPDSFLALSPDGRFLAFREADRAKKDDIEEDASNPVLITIVAADNDLSKSMRLRLRTSQSQFRWSTSGDAICYIEHIGDSSTIKCKDIFADTEPRLIVKIPDTRIYHFQWANEKDLVVSRGKTQDDAILIKNFD